jgi:peptidoglycan/xylan/chitin deacetylase (PgdA/CDA1 family)
MAAVVGQRVEQAGTRVLGAALRRRARTRSGSDVRMVLAYHGVRSPDRPAGLFPPMLEVDAFRAHLDHLRRSYEVVSLKDIASAAAEAGTSHPRVALTFDDDLRSHLEIAAPLLSERGLPATFFLTGSSLDGSGFSEWWHDVEALVEQGDGSWSRARERLARSWPWAIDAAPDEFAVAVLRSPPGPRAEIAAGLRELVGGPTGDPGLDAASVAELAARGFEIGFHTRNHEPLDTLDDATVDSAVAEGLEELAAAAGRRPTSIAYPHGRADLRAVHAAREAGFELGVGISEDRAIRATDRPMMLPRIDPCRGSCGVEAFAFRLARIGFAASRERA